MKSYGDTLVTIGQPLIDCELISYILASHGSKYDPIITSLTTQLNLMNFQEIYGHLLYYELFLEQQHASLDLNNAIVNISTHHTLNLGKLWSSNSRKNLYYDSQ